MSSIETQIINTLRANGPSTLQELAKALGLRCSEVRVALAVSNGSISTELTLREGATKKVRTFDLSETAHLVDESRLLTLAETGTAEELNAATCDVLHAAAVAFDLVVRKKAKKVDIIQVILDKRAADYLYCVTDGCGEPVEHVDELCAICEETIPKTPKRSRRSDRTVDRSRVGKPRRPDVELNLDAKTLGRISQAVAPETSTRGKQRAIANILLESGFVHAEVLRTLCRKHDCLNAANFTINLKKDGFKAKREGRTILGWTR